MNIKRLLIQGILLLFTVNSFAVDFALSPGGFVFFPAGTGNETADKHQRYDIGGGGGLGLEADIASIIPNPLGIGYTAGIEGGLQYNPYKNGDGSMRFLSFGGVLGVYYYPLSRLPVRLDAGLGVYTANDGDEKTAPGLWLRFGGETGFRFTPAFTLTAGAGWRQFQSINYSRPFNSGVYAGLGARLTFELGEQSAGGARISVLQDGPVYPVLGTLYQKFPVGTVVIQNQENAEIRDVRIFFRAGNYTSSEFPGGSARLIPKGKSAELPLYADFSPEILRFADSGRFLGEIVVRYTFLGRERETSRTVSVSVNNRNTTAPGDNAALAAFVSPNSPEVLQFSKYVAGEARLKHRLGLNTTMEFGIWLFEGIKAAGISVKAGDSGKAFPGEAQFPSQTLAYGSGSIPDITLLYMAVLEAAGIRSAFIVLPDGEFLGAIDLGINSGDAAASALFNGRDRLLVSGNELWLPLAMSKLGGGFTAAWQEGIARIDALQEKRETAEMVIVENAWGTYPPADFPALGIRIAPPEIAAMTAAANSALDSYARSEFPPMLADIQRQIQSRPTAALYNQLGNIHLRMGNISQAKTAYEQAAGMGSAGAMANRGNIALHENDTAAAERWFTQALSREPDNKTALRGMEYVEVRK